MLELERMTPERAVPGQRRLWHVATRPAMRRDPARAGIRAVDCAKRRLPSPTFALGVKSSCWIRSLVLNKLRGRDNGRLIRRRCQSSSECLGPDGPGRRMGECRMANQLIAHGPRALRFFVLLVMAVSAIGAASGRRSLRALPIVAFIFTRDGCTSIRSRCAHGSATITPRCTACWRHLGFDRVMNWPMLESIPAPLSEEDAAALREYRHTIDDAHAAGLKFWLAQTPNLTPPASIADRPWKRRNPYPVWRQVRLDDAADAAAYFAHRKAMMAIVNQADAYVTIDGDPGGYAGAKPDDWLSVFLADRAAIDACGAHPQTQQVIPWVWCGWGTEKVWGGNPNNAPEQDCALCRAHRSRYSHHECQNLGCCCLAVRCARTGPMAA